MSYWITLVGGGGKTTTMFYLANYYSRLNHSVIVTTTTNIAKLKERDFGINVKLLMLGEGKFYTKRELEIALREMDLREKGSSLKQQEVRHRTSLEDCFKDYKVDLETENVKICKQSPSELTLARQVICQEEEKKCGKNFIKNAECLPTVYVIVSHESKGKLKGICEKQCKELDGLAEVILVEGDGAKCLPIKVPLDHEPVIPALTNEVLICMGMDAICQRASKVCFRFERAKEIFGFDDGHILTEEDVADILTSEFGGRKNVDSAKISFVLNKVDSEERKKAANKIEKKIRSNMKEIGLQDREVSVYQTCYLDGEFYQPIKEYEAEN